MAGILKLGLQTEISSLKPRIDKRTLPSNYLDMPKSNKYHDNLTVHSITQIGDFWI